MAISFRAIRRPIDVLQSKMTAGDELIASF
jgi:hypothetical protein